MTQEQQALRVTGETGPVLWAAGHLLAPAATPSDDGTDGDAWFLLDQGQPGVTTGNLAPLDFSRELAVVRLERTGVHVATGQAVALLDQRGAHPAIRKLIGTAHRQAVAETALELLGPSGAAEGEASYEFLLTRCLSIAGGTTQILLNQVAERVLGLPR